MNVFTVTSNGPLECRGEIQIFNKQGTLLATESETWLCRCGQSASKPYCDGSHKRCEFLDDSMPGSAAVSEIGEGALRVTVRSNGPLRLEGPCEVRDADGRLLYCGAQTALCRCGKSANKPFCDGTHRAIEFIAA